MLHPRRTVYWQFFIDDNVNSHYFGGIGPEILGTMLITIVGMLFVIPLGIISAAYLVECASDGWVMRIIRMGINTLAGVPSIVFGLFGLAFFVLFLFPLLGFEPKPCILAASMTLAVLTLPVMIRASEEAIRSRPAVVQGRLAGPGGQPVPYVCRGHVPGGPARDSDRGHSEPQPHRRRDRADPLHGGRIARRDAALGLRSDADACPTAATIWPSATAWR